jgi:mRNA-degrading endonuclease RelE of RelBE toxin-antitoxin system
MRDKSASIWPLLGLRMVSYTGKCDEPLGQLGRGNTRFEVAFTRTAAGHVRSYRKLEQQIILNTIDEPLRHEPTTETRNRKGLSENELADWELRVQDFRVFYDVVVEDERRVVKIKAVGHKEHNVLRIGDREVQL